MIENPVFIVGTERSGSNLLRLMLNETKEITIPHPPHLMRDLAPVVSRYGDLAKEINFGRLAQDAVRLVRLHFAPWPLQIDVNRILTEAPARDLYSIYACIYEQYRGHMGKERWGCKSTFMIRHVQEVLAHHKAPQFIHLVRDVRDVAVSARRSVFCHYHPYYVAKLWSDEQNEAMRWQKSLAPETWMTLRYEDLIQNPESSVKEVCRFLGVKYSKRLLNFFEQPAAQELSGLSRSWENVAQPVIRDNASKYKKHLTPGEIRLIESVAQKQMEHYRYWIDSEPMQLAAPEPNPLKKARYRMQEEWMMWKEEGKALLKDRNARSRLLKKSYLLSLRLR
jgi:hypothetical protein